MDKTNTISITGYPMYLLNTDTMQVISYHKSYSGKLRSVEWNDHGQPGYRLYNNGKSKFFTLDMLKREVEINKVRELVNMFPDKKTGIVATGDWIVGSISKSGGSFSTSSYPARHATREIARAEAARLATVEKNKKFVVLKVDSIASAQEINWE